MARRCYDRVIMIGFLPITPGGDTTEARWKKSVEERLRQLRMMDVPNALVHRTTRGVAIIPKAGGKGVPGVAAPVQMFVVEGIEKEFLICKDWDGEIEGEAYIHVAKPPELRYSITKAIIEGVAVTYTYDDDPGRCQRTCASAVDSEVQIIIPRYKIGKADVSDERIGVIYAAPVKDDNAGVVIPGTPEETIKWIDINVAGRAWARKFVPAQ